MTLDAAAELHERAMRLCDVADRTDDSARKVSALRRAWRLAHKAALAERIPYWRAVYFKSAAWCALQAGRPRQAFRMAMACLRVCGPTNLMAYQKAQAHEIIAQALRDQPGAECAKTGE